MDLPVRNPNSYKWSFGSTPLTDLKISSYGTTTTAFDFSPASAPVSFGEPTTGPCIGKSTTPSKMSWSTIFAAAACLKLPSSDTTTYDNTAQFGSSAAQASAGSTGRFGGCGGGTFAQPGRGSGSVFTPTSKQTPTSTTSGFGLFDSGGTFAQSGGGSGGFVGGGFGNGNGSTLAQPGGGSMSFGTIGPCVDNSATLMFGLTQSSAAQTPTSITGGRIAGGGFVNGNGVNFAQPGGGSSMFESTHDG